MIADIIKSFGQFAKHILFGKQLDVLLYYPQHFNRSKNGTNPYFDPIVEVCKENRLQYLVLEEPDGRTSNPRAVQCVKADALFWTVIVLRKVIRFLSKESSLEEIDCKIGKILDALTFHKLRAKRYISISNSGIDFLRSLNPLGIVYDYQHGIIYKGHPGYFETKKKMTHSYESTNQRLMLWGGLYKRAFDDLMSKSELEKKIKVVGYPIKATSFKVDNFDKKHIVVSLQMTPDNELYLKHTPEMLIECLEHLKDLGYSVLLKHHPRFNNEVDLSYITKRFPFTKFTSKSLTDLAPSALLHITWTSTACFEYANYGIPTYFLLDELMNRGHEIFYDNYFYPLYDKMKLEDVITRILNKALYEVDCRIVKEWYDSAYAPFDKEQMLKILTGNEE